MRAFRKLLKILGVVALVFLVVAGAAATVVWHHFRRYATQVGQFDLSEIGSVSQRSAVFDRHGALYSHIEGANRIVVPLNEVSNHFIKALLAREDQRFWDHSGVDPQAIFRAALTNTLRGGIHQGASTLTQQLARNRFNLTERSYRRKVLEALLAHRIERSFTKREILQYYVNQIYFGNGYYGVETASKGYFGKHASELNLSDAALLAGLIRSPTRLSPLQNLDGATRERDVVLEQMLEQGRITPEEATAAKASRPSLHPTPVFQFEENYAVDAVRRELETLLSREVIELGGLQIHTALDPDLQRTAERIADESLTAFEKRKGYPHPTKAAFQPGTSAEEEKPTDYLQTAIVVVDNATGGICAIVGGRDYNQSKYPRAWLGMRQIGSTFKPFIYATAFAKGMLPGTYVDDSAITPVDLKGYARDWSPKNSDGDNLGMQRAGLGLVKSRNTMTVRVGLFAGLKDVQTVANSVGIGARMQPYPASLIGAFETTLKDLTGAYTVFPNNGIFRSPHLISKITGRNGEVLYEAKHIARRVMDPGVAWLVNSLLQQVMQVGTAARSESMGWTLPAGGKTGTTDDFKDAWFVGYTTSLTCGVWVGMDKPETIIQKGYGATLALPEWIEVMRQAVKQNYPAEPLRPPGTLSKVNLCSISGQLATNNCISQGLAYSMSLPESVVPKQTCTQHRDYMSAESVPQTQDSAIISGIPPAPAPAPASESRTSRPPLQPFYPEPGSSMPAEPPPIASGPPSSNSTRNAWQNPNRVDRTQPRSEASSQTWDRNPRAERIERALPVQPEASQRIPRTQLILTPDGRIIRIRTIPPAVPLSRDQEEAMRRERLRQLLRDSDAPYER